MPTHLKVEINNDETDIRLEMKKYYYSHFTKN